MKKPGGIAADRLRSFLDRVERLEEGTARPAADIREIYAEAKGRKPCVYRRAIGLD